MQKQKKSQLSSRERVMTSLHHKEPDRVPFTLSSTGATEVSIIAYENLLKYLGLEEKVEILSFNSQRAVVSDYFLKKFNVDTRGIYTYTPLHWKIETFTDNKYDYYKDGWGIVRRKPKTDGFYYDIYKYPMAEINTDNIDKYPWPDPYDPQILKDGRNRAIQMRRETQAALIVGRTFGNGIFTMGSWLEGFEKWFVDLLQDPKRACKIMDKILDLKIQYWDRVLAELGDLIDVVVEYDDLGGQQELLISPRLYRKYVKPRQKKLFNFIKKKAPVSLFFHTDGVVYDIIPDFIEVGVDILNPIQFTLAKMDAKKLKGEFGDSLTFCGAGIDTQHTLPFGSPQQVKDEVRRQIDILAPGGGFIFATVHAVQADVPPENFISMWEALQEYGIYI